MFFQQLLTSEKVIFCLYIAIAALTLLGLIIFGIVLAKLTGRKFIKSCKVISDFANEAGTINDGNLEQFEATCLDDKTNPSILEGWEAFKAARFGYPSEYVDKDNTLAPFQPKKFKISLAVYAAIVFAIAVVTSVYSIITTSATYQYCLVFAVVAMVLPVILLLAYVFVKPQKKVEEVYDQTMDDLDTAVQLQRFVERKLDNARLFDIAGKIRDVILAEQTKPIPSKKDQLEKRKLAEEQGESIDDVRDDLLDDEPVEYVAEEPAEVPAEPVDAAPAEPEPAPEAPAPKKVVPFEPFVGLLNEAIDHGYPKATLRKLANILVLAFGKFTEPSQREALKNSIRRFIVAYKAAALREQEEAEAAALETEPVAEEVSAEEVPAEEIPEVAADEEETVAPATVEADDLDEIRDEIIPVDDAPAENNYVNNVKDDGVVTEVTAEASTVAAPANDFFAEIATPDDAPSEEWDRPR